VTLAVVPQRSDPRAELDEVTLKRAQRGDRDAWRALVERYQVPVFALVGRMLGRNGPIEDVAQDAFLAVFRALPKFSASGPARLSSWILAIASRRAIDELRKRRERGIAEEPITTAHPGRRTEIAVAVERAVASLAPEYRAVFLLREYHELEYGEIADALAIDLGTVKSRLSRARAALRTALAEVHDG
jgi:RNA polymerase sigma-70 factor (ECF subfamily)